jgi:16S rRNA G1207 methylase RsmC
LAYDKKMQHFFGNVARVAETLQFHVIEARLR